MEANHPIQFQMRIASIDVLRFAIHEVNGFDKSANDIFEYQSEFGFNVFEENNQVGIEMTVVVRVRETGELFSDLKVLMKFEILPFNLVIIKKNEKTFNIPNEVMSNLLHVTAGTARGILYERLKGTIAHLEIYPLLDINQLFADRSTETMPEVSTSL